MARRPHGAERGVGGAGHDQIHAQHRGAGGATRGRQRVTGHHRIAFVEADHRVIVGRAFLDRVDISGVVDPLKLLTRGQRRVAVAQRQLQAGSDQPVLDRVQPFGLLRMVARDPVPAAVGV